MSNGGVEVKQCGLYCREKRNGRLVSLVMVNHENATKS